MLKRMALVAFIALIPALASAQTVVPSNLKTMKADDMTRSRYQQTMEKRNQSRETFKKNLDAQQAKYQAEREARKQAELQKKAQEKAQAQKAVAAPAASGTVTKAPHPSRFQSGRAPQY